MFTIIYVSRKQIIWPHYSSWVVKCMRRLQLDLSSCTLVLVWREDNIYKNVYVRSIVFCKSDLAYGECIQLLSHACFCCFSTFISMAFQIFRCWVIVMLCWFCVINSFKYCIFHMICYCELLARPFKSKTFNIWLIITIVSLFLIVDFLTNVKRTFIASYYM